MSDSPVALRPLRFGFVGLALLLTGYNGLVEGLNATHFADTPGMKAATVAQLLYGICAAGVVIAWWARARLAFRILVLWGTAVVALGVLAPVVYAGRPWSHGLAVGAGTALVVGLVLWAWPGARLPTERTP